MGVFAKNGTPLHGPPLCETCVHAHVEHGFRESEQLVICQATYPERRVPFRVRECTGYVEVKRQSLKQMEEIAWILAPRGAKRQAGFAPPKSPGSDEREVELILSSGEKS
jgi:hypothetical protein